MLQLVSYDEFRPSIPIIAAPEVESLNVCISDNQDNDIRLDELAAFDEEIEAITVEIKQLHMQREMLIHKRERLAKKLTEECKRSEEPVP